MIGHHKGLLNIVYKHYNYIISLLNKNKTVKADLHTHATYYIYIYIIIHAVVFKMANYE